MEVVVFFVWGKFIIFEKIIEELSGYKREIIF